MLILLANPLIMYSLQNVVEHLNKEVNVSHSLKWPFRISWFVWSTFENPKFFIHCHKEKQQSFM